MMSRTGALGALAALAAVAFSTAACLPRERFNKACEWTGDTAFPLDLQKPDDRAHLVVDAQLSEELATRFADVAEVQGLSMWATITEMARIGNDHLGPARGARIPWDHHNPALFAGVAIAVLWAALVNSPTRRLTNCT